MTYEVAARSDPEIAALPDRRERATIATLDLAQMHLSEFDDLAESAK